jgi:hypothetical protein
MITDKSTKISPDDPELWLSFLYHFKEFVDKENARFSGISFIFHLCRSKTILRIF